MREYSPRVSSAGIPLIPAVVLVTAIAPPNTAIADGPPGAPLACPVELLLTEAKAGGT
jgi:hypothetical protein